MDETHSKKGPTTIRFYLQHPWFAIVVAIPLLLICYYLWQLIEYLKRVLPSFVEHNWGYLLVGAVVLLTPLWWRCYRAFTKHQDERYQSEAYRALLYAVTDQARLGYDLKFTNPKTGDVLELTNPYGEPVTVTQVQEEPLLLAAPREPEAIPTIIRYADIVGSVPSDMSLLGVHPSDGSLELTNWEKLKMLWLVGSSNTGKSNTIFGKALEAVNKAAKLLVVDQHAAKEDSLARKLQPLRAALLCPIAVKDEEVEHVLQFFKIEFERRVAGASCAQKIVLICDEMNRMVRNERLKKGLQEIVAICGEEARGFGMYGWFISQKAAHLKWLRDSAITVIAHKVTRFEEALLACNDDRKAARRLLGFPIGRSYIYGVDFDEPVELQQPLYTAGDVVLSTFVDLGTSKGTSKFEEVGTSETDERIVHFNARLKQREVDQAIEFPHAQKTSEEDGEKRARIARVAQMMAEGKSINEMLKIEWGILNPGGRYQAALLELREIQKIIAHRAIGENDAANHDLNASASSES